MLMLFISKPALDRVPQPRAALRIVVNESSGGVLSRLHRPGGTIPADLRHDRLCPSAPGRVVRTVNVPFAFATRSDEWKVRARHAVVAIVSRTQRIAMHPDRLRAAIPPVAHSTLR